MNGLMADSFDPGRTEMLARNFLLQHIDADEIVVDGASGLPVKAVYSGPTRTGQMRTRPVAYWFSCEGVVDECEYSA